MTTMDLSRAADNAAAEAPQTRLQTWLPPEAPLEMPRQVLEPARTPGTAWAPLLQLLTFRTRA